ncbi:hypothetical protein IFM89_018533 [Coptis chinensis]|uniref:Uncharacterized protein n=1 Tax=Coptis chinensis TaxID=261450 RepID=A0A835HU60_9MAGN|nr:hypothetical protein IFM89_018533 [Coptis chinensis]
MTRMVLLLGILKSGEKLNLIIISISPNGGKNSLDVISRRLDAEISTRGKKFDALIFQVHILLICNCLIVDGFDSFPNGVVLMFLCFSPSLRCSFVSPFSKT